MYVGPSPWDFAPPTKPTEGGYVAYPEKVAGIKICLKSKKFKDYISQLQLFWNSQSPPEKMHLISALGFELDHCDDPIVYNRMTERLCDIDLELAQTVAEKVGAPTPTKPCKANTGQKSAGLIFTAYNAPEPTIASRRVAILVGDGYDSVAFDGVYVALKAAMALPFVIGPKRQPVLVEGETKGGKGVRSDHHFEGMRSTMLDSIFIAGGAPIESLCKQGRVVHWVREAFSHKKAIGATGEAVNLVKTAREIDGMTFSAAGSHDVVDSYGVVTAGALNISQHKNFDCELDGLFSMVAF